MRNGTREPHQQVLEAIHKRAIVNKVVKFHR